MMFLQKPMLGTQIDWSNPFNAGLLLDLLMNEGHGDRVNDLSGYGNHGTLHDFDFPPSQTSGWNPGLDGVCLAFDGDNDYIDCGNGFNFGAGSFAFEMQVLRRSSADAQYGGIYNGNGNGSTERGWLFRLRSDGTAQFSGGDNTVNVFKIITSPVLSDDEWGDFAGVLDRAAGVAILYKDGIEVGRDSSVTDGNVDYLGDLYIGRDWSLDHMLNGSIARVRILPRAMSAFEVMQTQINPYGVYLQ